MSTQAIVYEYGKTRNDTITWVVALALELVCSLFIFGFMTIVPMLGFSALGAWLAQRKSVVMDRWMSSRNLYLLSGLGFLAALLLHTVVFPWVTSLNHPTFSTDSGRLAIYIVQLFIFGMISYLLNRKWQHVFKTLTITWPLYMLAPIMVLMLNSYVKPIWFTMQVEIVVIELAVIWGVFGNLYEPNFMLLAKKEWADIKKLFTGSMAVLFIAGMILGKFKQQEAYALTGMIYVCIYAIFLGARTFAGEREHHTYDYLSVRPIDPRILFGVKYKISFLQIVLMTYVVMLIATISENTLSYDDNVLLLAAVGLFAIIPLWFYSFSLLISVLTADTVRAALFGFVSGILSLFGVIALFVSFEHKTDAGFSYGVAILLLLLIVMYGLIGILHESLQRKRLVWKGQYLGWILFSIGLGFCLNLIIWSIIGDESLTVEYVYLLFKSILSVLVFVSVIGLGYEAFHQRRITWNLGYLAIVGISLGVYVYGQTWFHGDLKPVKTLPATVHGYMTTIPYHAQEQIGIQFQYNTTLNTRYDMSIINLSDPLNPVFNPPYFHIKDTFYRFVNPSTMMTKEFGVHGTQLVVYDFSDFKHPRETYRETLSKNTISTVTFLYSTKDSMYFMDRWESAEILFMKSPPGMRLGAMPFPGSIINQKSKIEYIQVNLNNFKDIRHLSSENNPDLYDRQFYNPGFTNHYAIRWNHRYYNAIYDISDENHPRLVYQTPIGIQNKYRFSRNLWGQDWSGMTVQGNLLYGCTEDDLIAIYDIQNIQNPKPLGSVKWSVLDKVAFNSKDNYKHPILYNNLLIVQYMRGFAMVDVSNPAKPVLLGKYNTTLTGGFPHGNYYYTWNDKDMFIFDTRRLTR